MAFAFIADLSTNLSILLIVCVVAVCVFEAINGFHDTANAVATVIYTKTLPAKYAVVWSGCWNFIGAMVGGLAVAMSMMKLMPLNDMMNLPIGENIALVLAILTAAIAWNLGTWYFGIPCSSSHTMVGSLLGGGFAFFNIHQGAGPNWDKAKDIGMSLLISPLFGFALAIGLMFLLRATVKSKVVFKEPSDKKEPPIWIRGILIATCTLVSFFHGSNDGQKGVGLLLVVLIAFLPMQFALDPSVSTSSMSGNVKKIEQTLLAGTTPENSEAFKAIISKANSLSAQLDTVDTKNKKEIFAARKGVQSLNKNLDAAIKGGTITGETAKAIKSETKGLAKSYEFAPFWIIFLISLCLGVGTMFGWKRIVYTIGERIGKSHLTYAQGASAELCAAATIGMSSYYGLPVSTTHVLASGVAGTMVAEGGTKNLRRKTVTSIALAWLLTLPVTFIASALLFFLYRMFF
jgi:inorganic phosphate transporter, PiT family